MFNFLEIITHVSTYEIDIVDNQNFIIIRILSITHKLCLYTGIKQILKLIICDASLYLPLDFLVELVDNECHEKQ